MQLAQGKGTRGLTYSPPRCARLLHATRLPSPLPAIAAACCSADPRGTTPACGPVAHTLLPREAQAHLRVKCTQIVCPPSIILARRPQSNNLHPGAI
nr:unnamed protein product [Digitaria exilis]